ncbi:MAG: dihydroorotate dehydrogenase [Candidatus Moranbacteria bacterium]|nr:dihydroorotate dehydrogenase [Candidatus Moranbacteria bacterium]
MNDIPKVGNAAGTCNRRSLFEKLLKSAADIITVGPMSVKQRDTNPGNNEYQDDNGSVNSLGLPNGGIEWYREHLPEMIAQAEACGKTLALSVPPIDPGDMVKLAEECVKLRVPIAELNAGCNHVFVGNAQKIPLSYYPEDLKRAIHTFVGIAGKACKLRLKLSPYLPVVPTEVTDAIRPYDIAVVACNTAGNAYMFREDFRPAIDFGEHLGGYGGSGFKPIVLGQIVQLRKMLPDHHIIGVGGAKNGRDMWEFMKVGANEVQFGSAWYFTEDARVFGDALAQFVDIIEQHPI